MDNNNEFTDFGEITEKFLNGYDNIISESDRSSSRQERYAFYKAGYIAALQPSTLPLIENKDLDAPIWYTKEVIYDCLIKDKYSIEIAEELSEKWATSNQFAFKKGWEKAYNDKKSGTFDYVYFPQSVPLIDKGEQRNFWDKVWDICMQAPSEEDFIDTCENQFTVNKKQ